MVKAVASWNMGIINYTTLCLIYLMNCYMVQSQYVVLMQNLALLPVCNME